jgi:hypothetical protein
MSPMWRLAPISSIKKFAVETSLIGLLKPLFSFPESSGEISEFTGVSCAILVSFEGDTDAQDR